MPKVDMKTYNKEPTYGASVTCYLTNFSCNEDFLEEMLLLALTTTLTSLRTNFTKQANLTLI